MVCFVHESLDKCLDRMLLNRNKENKRRTRVRHDPRDYRGEKMSRVGQFEKNFSVVATSICQGKSNMKVSG